MFRFTVNADAAIIGLDRWQQRLADLTPFWTEHFAPRFLQDIQDNWESQGAMVGGWAPLSPRYAAWKARRWGAHLGILELSLRLRGSLQWLNSAGGGDIGPEGVLRASPTTLEIGTAVPYGQWHQRGTSRMPARPFLFFTNSPDYEQLWRDWIAEQARAGGLNTA